MKLPSMRRGLAPAKSQASSETGSNASDSHIRAASGTAQPHLTISPFRPNRLNLALAGLILLAIAALLLLAPSWVAAQGSEPDQGKAPPAPAAPSSVSVTRADGSLTAS